MLAAYSSQTEGDGRMCPKVGDAVLPIWQVRRNHRKPPPSIPRGHPPQGEHRFPRIISRGGRTRTRDVG